MKEIIDLIKSTTRYQRNIQFGEPRSGHPEGKVQLHIEALEVNLQKIREKFSISEDYFWKLMFLIHVHDTFKAEVNKDSPNLFERSHAALAREFASQYTDDTDLLNMLQFHDLNYKLWKEYVTKGVYSIEEFQQLVDAIENWDVFLMFIIIDGCVDGKDYAKIPWFINEVRNHKNTEVDASWVLPLVRW